MREKLKELLRDNQPGSLQADMEKAVKLGHTEGKKRKITLRQNVGEDKQVKLSHKN